MKSKTTYVYYAIKTKILIEAYVYFGASQLKTKHAYGYFGQANKKYPGGVLLPCPGGNTFMLTINEYTFRSNLRNHKSRLQ